VGGSWGLRATSPSSFISAPPASPNEKALSFQRFYQLSHKSSKPGDITTFHMLLLRKFTGFLEAPDLEEGIIDADDAQTDTLEVQFPWEVWHRERKSNRHKKHRQTLQKDDESSR